MRMAAASSLQQTLQTQANGTVASTSTNVVHNQTAQQEQEVLYDQYTILFCRALYDYDAQDASALSFRRGEIIEVITQQPSGWWDGLLGEERGWFPSNYVTIISDEEAELAFAGQDALSVGAQVTESQAEPEHVDIPTVIMRGTQAENEEWLDSELSQHRETLVPLTNRSTNASKPSDFWMPEVTPDGQIYYVNTHTGQRSRDLPQEAEDGVEDNDLVGLTGQSSSRSGTTVRMAFGLNELPERLEKTAEVIKNGSAPVSIIPEQWIRKLDEGASTYYTTMDRRVPWSRPETQAETSSSSTSLPPVMRKHSDLSRLSAYSDDSDVHPAEDRALMRPSLSKIEPSSRTREKVSKTEHNQSVKLEIISTERIAKSLQQALQPPAPVVLTDLSVVTRSAIQAVIENIQNIEAKRQFEERRMDELILNVVLAVRNLLYVSAAPAGQFSSSQRDGCDARSATLKPTQRKVTATLSRLVLSARALQYDAGSHLHETLSRIGTDAEELDKAILSFVLEVQRLHTTVQHPSVEGKRLKGVFTTENVGLGLVGAGAGGHWKGLGWVPMLDDADSPQQVLRSEVVTEISSMISRIDANIVVLEQSLRVADEIQYDEMRLRVHDIITLISSFLTFVADIHIARHVDIDGIHHGSSGTINDRYSESVEEVRSLVRSLEAAVQAVYDDSSAIFLTAQRMHEAAPGQPLASASTVETFHRLSVSVNMNMNLVKKDIEAILLVGHEQADIAQGDYNGSIEWRMSQLSMVKGQISSLQLSDEDDSEFDNELDLDQALRKAQGPTGNGISNSTMDRNLNHSVDEVSEPSIDYALVKKSPESSSSLRDDGSNTLFDDDQKSKARPSGPNKLQRLLGKEYADQVAADTLPWYLRTNYNTSELVIDPDNSIRGGTVAALVDRLTAHDQADVTFSKAFLMTYKSFTTLDELFRLLAERFQIQPPANLTPSEREEWGKLKQHVIQMRVINTLKSMVVDDNYLEKEDMHILDKMKEFLNSEDVSRFAAAKSLLITIERLQSSGDGMVKMVVTNAQSPPPQPIIPRSSKKLKLLDIDPLELARQITIVESQLYQKIKPMECLQRSREQKTENMDNITTVIQTSNRIANWVAQSVLSKEDSKKRAQAVKHLISTADRCRSLNNFSTMIAITSGLNTPPIRRLKRTWEQVNQRFMTLFSACEMTIDSNKNFTKYRQLMASVTPPCVPFIGVFLSTLQFIQDGNPDNLPGGLVNFRKRQKASEVINDIKRWQTLSFNLIPVPSILAYIEDSLTQFNDFKTSSEHFWTLSLEREPREREDEKMARLLQESGFL